MQGATISESPLWPEKLYISELLVLIANRDQHLHYVFGNRKCNRMIYCADAIEIPVGQECIPSEFLLTIFQR